jgi:hypothetical protein
MGIRFGRVATDREGARHAGNGCHGAPGMHYESGPSHM